MINETIKFGVRVLTNPDGTTYNHGIFWRNLKNLSFKEATNYLKEIQEAYPDYLSMIEPYNE
jgi:hypothetical protein